MVPLFLPQNYKEEWLEALSNIFDTRWLGQGPKVDEFEQAFGKKFGYEYCLATNSGSSALELAYHLIGIGEGDEVITTVFTCTATNIPLVRMGAKIVFADITEELTINYEDVLSKITDKTKAIVAVTLGGLPVDERLFEIGIPVVVDAAQSVGVSEKHGDYICYSFQAIKHFTTGDGGMLVVRNKDTYDRAKKLRWFGIDREAKRRVNFNALNNREITMEIEEAGYKFHMNDIQASMGLVGLRHSDEILEHRKMICEYYRKRIPQVEFLYGGSYWLITAFSARRDELIEHLRSRGIECDMVQLRNDIFKVFGGKRRDLPMMNSVENKYFYLPLHGQMKKTDVDEIANAIKEVMP